MRNVLQPETDRRPMVPRLFPFGLRRFGPARSGRLLSSIVSVALTLALTGGSLTVLAAPAAPAASAATRSCAAATKTAAAATTKATATAKVSKAKTRTAASVKKSAAAKKKTSSAKKRVAAAKKRTAKARWAAVDRSRRRPSLSTRRAAIRASAASKRAASSAKKASASATKAARASSKARSAAKAAASAAEKAAASAKRATAAEITICRTSSSPNPGTLSNRGAQPAGIVWDRPGNLDRYATPGGLVVAGRDNYADAAFKKVAAGGGTVLIYLDTVIDAPYGRYHEMLMKPSVCGAGSTGRWPGNQRANQWGYLGDFRAGSPLQKKLHCVLEKMVAENPQMGGWFADDIGSRSWFPDINWSTWSAANKKAYRDGAIALTKTFRQVADEHGLIVIVNGTWAANDGGGYPDPAKAGNALADGGFVEHHDGQIDFFAPYACSTQWASQSAVTHGKAFMYSVTDTDKGLTEYRNSGCFSYLAEQRSDDYGSAPTPWGSFHATGLPSRIRK